MANETNNAGPSQEQKKEIKKQVRKETRKFKRKTVSTVVILALIVGIIILLLAGKGLGLFGSGTGLGDGIDKLKGSISDALNTDDTDKKAETTPEVQEQTDVTPTEITDLSQSGEQTDVAGEGDETGVTSENNTGGEVVKEITISGNKIVYGEQEMESVDALKDTLMEIEFTDEDVISIVDDVAIKATCDEVESMLTSLGIAFVYADEE